MTSPQERMTTTLAKAGIPYRGINCYGQQIVVTTKGEATARKWAELLARVATVRGVLKSVDYAKENRNTVLKPTTIEVWRVFARI
jgi:hypothetical protein